MATSKGASATKSKAAGSDFSTNLNKMKAALQTMVAELDRMSQANGKSESPGKAALSSTAGAVAEQIAVWEDDPFLEAVAGADPIPAEPIKVDAPRNNQASLQTQLVDPQPDAGIIDPSSTPEFRAGNADAALARAINFWGPLLPGGTVWSTDSQPMKVQLDEGVDFNAFYARESGLNFYHGVVDRVDPPVTVFSVESPDVLCHELGHAILDAVKPELFDAMSNEVGAFHEAFGDMSATLSALQIPSLRRAVLDQCHGNLSMNSRLTQKARQLGWAIRIQVDPTNVDGDSLRNMCNNFFYQDPAGLPPWAPANNLSSEVHSFSRVFSGAFLDVLDGMFQIGPAGAAGDDSAKLEAIARDAGKLLIAGVRLASVVPSFFSQVAAGMIQADQTLNGGRYTSALTSSFVQRGILSPASAVSLARDMRTHGGQAFGVSRATDGQVHFDGDNDGFKKTGKDAPILPLRPITTRFGVTLHVHLPSEPHRFAAMSAAVAGGAEDSSSPEEDARSFVEDLIQTDRICQEGAPGVIPAELTSPGKASPCEKTHRLVKEDGKTVLKRHHFDCGFNGCKHGR